MIYHIIDNTSTHYSKIIPTFCRSEWGQNLFFIILVKETGDSPEEIKQIFQEKGVTNYYIAEGRSNEPLNLFFRLAFVLCGHSLTNSEIDVLNYMAKVRKSPIILHGIYYSALAPLLFFRYLKNVSWVCWNWSSKVSKRFFLLYIFHHMYRKWNLRQYTRIVTLMAPDARDIEKYTGRTGQACVIPYSRPPIDGAKFHKIENNNSLNVLLGNNAYHIPGYCSLLDNIKNYLDSVGTICCMIPYGGNNDAIAKFKNDYQNQLRNKISFWEDMYPDDVYKSKIVSYDVYICPAKIQSGLGAIYNALLSGLVVFLDGFNYDWIKEIGCYIHHTNELPEYLLNPIDLTDEQKKHNREAVIKLTDTQGKWDNLFAEISK